MSREPSAPHQGGHGAARVLPVAVVLTVLAIVWQTWWAIDQDKKLTLASENDHALIAVRLLEEHATLTLREAERNLDAVVRAAHASAKDKPLTDAGIRNLLARAQPFNKVLKSLQFVNPKGVASVSSIDYPAYQTDADDRTYIPYMLQHPDQKMQRLGRPFRRFYDGELVVPLARNIHGPDGRYLGIISTDISVSYFSGVYDRVAKDSKALVSLFSDEGQVIVRSPSDARYLGMDVSSVPVFERLQAEARAAIAAGRAAEGSFEDPFFLGDTEPLARSYVYRKIEGFPVTTLFARDSAAVLAPWRARTQDRLLFSGITVCFIVALSVLLMQHVRRLQQSRAALHGSEARLRHSESKFSDLFQYSPVPLILTRLDDSTFVEVNESWAAQMGYLRHELLGMTPMALKIWVNPQERVDCLALLKREREVVRMEVQQRHKQGHILICLVSARLLDFDGVQMALFSPIDVTRQRAIEQEIRDLNTQLEDRVQQRTVKLELANQELGQALTAMQAMQGELLRSEKMAALGSMVAGIAHELNTPIGIGVTISSTLHTQTQALLAELRSERPRRSFMESNLQACSEGAEVLQRTLVRQSELVRSFKQVAVDQSSESRRQFDLEKLLTELLVTLEPLRRKTPFALECRLEPGITMDSYPGALDQIITNLLSNAIAHAFEGRIQGLMQLSSRRLDGDRVEIVFQDDGVGIPPENRALVFDPFFTTKLGRGGSGLGLHIVYNLVNKVLGGKVDLVEDVAVGTTIKMVLPLRAPVDQMLVEAADMGLPR